jgi:ribosome-associated protein
MEQTLKEKSLEREIDGDAAAPETQSAQPEQLDERVETAVRAASDKKALNSIVLDLEKVADFTSYFLITSGTNPRQVQAIADGIEEELRKNGTRPSRIEGYNSAEWILLDYGDFIVHVFDQKQREFYDLERLWRDARRIQLPEGI